MAKRRRPKGKGRPSWLYPVLGVAMVGVVAALWMIVHPVDRSLEAQMESDDFAQAVRRLAERRDIPRSWIVEDDPIRKQDDVFVRTWRLTVPGRAVMDALAADLVAEASRRGMAFGKLDAGNGRTGTLRITGGVEAFDIRFSARKDDQRPKPTAAAEVAVATLPVATASPRLPEGTTARMAVLLDDAGQNMELIADASKLPAEIGIAVLPFLPASANSAKALYRAGHEIWLHLPMEPAGYPEENPGPGAVFVAMSEDEIRATVHEAVNNVPHVVGVNNHMGSKATTDLSTMTWVMQEIKGRGLAFIDSRTSVDTVAEDAARAQGVPSGRRHVFLDNERTASAVRAQLEQALLRALAGEDVIAIGHLAPVTIDVLSEEAPKLRAWGVTLVPPSAIVNVN